MEAPSENICKITIKRRSRGGNFIDNLVDYDYINNEETMDIIAANTVYDTSEVKNSNSTPPEFCKSLLPKTTLNIINAYKGELQHFWKCHVLETKICPHNKKCLIKHKLVAIFEKKYDANLLESQIRHWNFCKSLMFEMQLYSLKPTYCVYRSRHDTYESQIQDGCSILFYGELITAKVGDSIKMGDEMVTISANINKYTYKSPVNVISYENMRRICNDHKHVIHSTKETRIRLHKRVNYTKYSIRRMYEIQRQSDIDCDYNHDKTILETVRKVYGEDEAIFINSIF